MAGLRRLNRLIFPLLSLLMIVAAVAAIPSPIPVARGLTYSYDLFGAYDENGLLLPPATRAINCTLYRSDNSTISFLLNGTYTISAGSLPPIAFKFILGPSESRTFFLTNSTTHEHIYVFWPSSPYYAYYVNIKNYVGVQNGYLESLINVNGTDLIVERWSINTVSDLPFTMTFGSSYKLRLVCDSGVFYYPDFVAGASTTLTLSITEDMFPLPRTSLAGITVNAARMNSTRIKAAYYDSYGNTTWVYIMVAALGSATPIASTNVSSSSVTYNWYEADETEDYYVLIQVSHVIRGVLYWTFVCSHIQPKINPFSDLDIIFGTSTIFPLAMSELPGLFVLLFVFAAFSIWNAGVGVVVGVLFAAFESYVGFISIPWNWISTTLCIAVIVALSIHKEREPN